MANENNVQGGNKRAKVDKDGKVVTGTTAAGIAGAVAVGAVVVAKIIPKAGKTILRIGKLVISLKK